MLKFSHLICIGIATTLSMVTVAKPTQFYKPYKSTEVVENIQPKLYQLGQIDVDFTSKINRSEFLAQENLQNLYKEKLETSLKSKNLLADEMTKFPISINLEIHQKRIFAGEAFGEKLSGKYAHTEFEYSSSLQNSNKTLATFKSSQYIGIGKHGNFGKILRDISGQGKPEHELADIDAFIDKIVNDLPK